MASKQTKTVAILLLLLMDSFWTTEAVPLFQNWITNTNNGTTTTTESPPLHHHKHVGPEALDRRREFIRMTETWNRDLHKTLVQYILRFNEHLRQEWIPKGSSLTVPMRFGSFMGDFLAPFLVNRYVTMPLTKQIIAMGNMMAASPQWPQWLRPNNNKTTEHHHQHQNRRSRLDSQPPIPETREEEQPSFRERLRSRLQHRRENS